jgi:hypothetical protein
MTIIDEILESRFFTDRPPVLLDVGASGEIHPAWKPLARHSICIAFDADDRETELVAGASKGYKALHLFRKIVTDTAIEETDFYLTRFPYSSSLLEPDQQGIGQWNFGNLFDVERVVRLKAITLTDALRQAGVTTVDWFKTDSQGTDLRLFKSLGDDLINKMLVAEFEPGILDAYRGEDKLYNVMQFMDTQPFWMSDLQVRGTQRISKRSLQACIPGYDGSYLDTLPCKTAPGWAEIMYFNTFANDTGCLDPRDYLLGWIFALIEGQHGFALDIALSGKERFNLPVFADLASHTADLVTHKQDAGRV